MVQEIWRETAQAEFFVFGNLPKRPFEFQNLNSVFRINTAFVLAKRFAKDSKFAILFPAVLF